MKMFAAQLKAGDVILGPISARRLRVIESKATPMIGEAPWNWTLICSYDSGLTTDLHLREDDLIEVVESPVTAEELADLAAAITLATARLWALAERLGYGRA